MKEAAPLLTIYSPELLAAERELVSLLDTRDRSASPEGRASAERLSKPPAAGLSNGTSPRNKSRNWKNPASPPSF